MSTIRNGKVPAGATAADCGRLWITLTKEFVPALRLEIRIVTAPPELSYLVVEVVDDSVVSIDGEAQVNVWSRREFRSELYLISVDQLFGLLIDAYKQLDDYFRIGSACAPTLRAK